MMLPDQFVVYLILLVVLSRIVAQLLLTTTSITIPLTQAANPVASAGCHSLDIGPIPATFSTENGSVTPNDLLDSLQQLLCNDNCSVPAEIRSSVAAIAQTGSTKVYCEISVVVTSSAEVYMYRTFPLIGVEQPESWDSIQHIIKTCAQNQAKHCWSNGYGLFSLCFPPAVLTQYYLYCGADF